MNTKKGENLNLRKTLERNSIKLNYDIKLYDRLLLCQFSHYKDFRNKFQLHPEEEREEMDTFSIAVPVRSSFHFMGLPFYCALFVIF